MRKVVNETNKMYQDLTRKMSTKSREDLKDPSVTCSVVVSNETIKRNKRLALAYLNTRMDRIKKMWWTQGSIIPDEMKTKLHQAEKDFFEGYDKIMADYSQELDIDLTSDMNPPRDHMVQVRILKDYGEVLLRSGQFIDLKRSSIFMLRSDVETLLQKGIAVQLRD
eukprot:CAMPEP_0114492098 /NCGR_PEP_ID=MMETSP0109-20121206/3363_1 /TAXON_ID=29199 /ORGANISM="Chlorarachnion reptans, Strain CCCM449" /LENGTH=165 /DNA_ID=CAMNT_0001668897 /DNA_START=190 /DNA_END=687 /DNA_ORIENTATION=-